MGGSVSALIKDADKSAEGEEDDESEEAKKKRIAPGKEVLKSDFSSMIEISMRLEELARPGNIFIMVYAKWSSDAHWLEIGKTETTHDKSKGPSFEKSFLIDFKVESQRLLRFEVYRVRDIDARDDLSLQKFLGAVTCSLVEVMMARSKFATAGWFVQELKVPIPKVGEPIPGRLAVFAEEDTNAKQTVSFVLAGQSIPSTDLWKLNPDPYCIINRTTATDPDDEEEEEADLEVAPVYRTEVARRTGKPRWKSSELTATQICGIDNDQEIVIEVWDWFRVSKHRYIGEVTTSLTDICKAFRETRPLVCPIYLHEGKRKSKKKTKKGSKISGGGSRSGTKGSSGSKGSKGSKGSNLSDKARRMLMGSKDTRASKDSRASSGRSSRRNSAKSTSSPTSAAGSAITGATTSSGNSGTSKKSKSSSASLKQMGNLIFEDIGVMRAYTFLDYIRGGLELKLAVGIDLTRSNVGPENPDSNHHFDNTKGSESAYATAIRAIGDVMRSYDGDDKYPVYGFGAQIPPSQTVCSDCFSLTGDFWDPEVDGVEGIIRAYKRALQICRLHGPSHIHEVIKLCAEMARPYAEARTPPDNGVEMKYFVFLILTDGLVHQQQKVVDEVMASLGLPMSIIVIGIGDADFSFLRSLAEDISSLRKAAEKRAYDKDPEAARAAAEQAAKAAAAAQAAAAAAAATSGGSKRKGGKKTREDGPRPKVLPRDIVHFVSYDEFRGRPEELAAATLAELPKEVVSYYTGKHVAPRGLEKYEDENGAPLPKTLPMPPPVKKEDGSKSRAGSNSRSGTKASVGTAASRTSSTLTTAEDKSAEEAKKKLESLPPFLREERDRVIAEAQRLGYERFMINRALRDGVPSASIEVLVDNMVNGGYGKNPCYKDAAETAIPEPVDMELASLPGQPDSRMLSMMSTLTDFDFGSSLGSPLATAVTNFGGGFGSTTKSQNASKEGMSTTSGFKSREGTKDAGRRYSRTSKESVNSNPTKGILKSGSRETSKDLPMTAGSSALGAPIASRRNLMGTTKESVGSIGSSGSLRGTAAVRFSDDDAEAAPEQPELPSAGGTCALCQRAAVTTEFQPCGCQVACGSCALDTETCPICHSEVFEVMPLG